MENIYESFKVGKKIKVIEVIVLGLELFVLLILEVENLRFNFYKEVEKYFNEKV